jgi:glutamate mutase epsilon subunit
VVDYLSSDRLDWEEMQKERQAVLAAWQTGREVDLAEAVDLKF